MQAVRWVGYVYAGLAVAAVIGAAANEDLAILFLGAGLTLAATAALFLALDRIIEELAAIRRAQVGRAQPGPTAPEAGGENETTITSPPRSVAEIAEDLERLKARAGKAP
jgi:hypothetical protein